MNKIKKTFTLLFAVLFAPAAANANEGLSVSDVHYSDVYANWVIEIGIENPNITYTSFQCDIAIPNGFTFKKELYAFTSRAEKTVMGKAQNTHALYSSVHENGNLRLVVASLDNSDFSGTGGAILVQAVTPKDASLDRSNAFKANVTNIVLTHNDQENKRADAYYQQGIFNNTSLKCYDAQCINTAIYGSISDSELEMFNNGLATNDSLATIDLRHCTNTESLGTLTLKNPNAIIYADRSGQVSGNRNVVVDGLCPTLTLTDKHPYRPHESFTASRATFSITVSAAGCATLALPFSCNTPSGLISYTLSEIREDVVMGQRTMSVTAHKPVLIKGISGNYTFAGSTQQITIDNAPVDGLLRGTYIDGTVPSDSYVLQKQNDDIGFYIVKEDVEIDIEPFRAYLTSDNSSGIRYMNLHLDETTSYDIPYADDETTKRYDVMGNRINAPVQGINILKTKNGTIHKIIVK